MPNFFGENLNSVAEMADAFRRHGDAARCTYRGRYVFDDKSQDPYRGTTLERPVSMAGNKPGDYYPWEQIFLAAASCAGSDYPMLARHWNVPLVRVEFVVDGVFDPRWEFEGLDEFQCPPDAAGSYLSLHLTATLTSGAPGEVLTRMHRRVIERNMVLGALRGIPRTDELRIERP